MSNTISDLNIQAVYLTRVSIAKGMKKEKNYVVNSRNGATYVDLEDCGESRSIIRGTKKDVMNCMRLMCVALLQLPDK